MRDIITHLLPRLMKHLWSFIAAIATIGSLLSLTSSTAIRTWINEHSYWVFLALILAVGIVIFFAIHYAGSVKRKEPSTHDRSVVAKILKAIPPDGKTIIWLKELYVTKYAPVKHIDTLDEVHDQMERNVIGLDDRKASRAYLTLKNAIADFYTVTTFELFLDDHNDRMLKMKWYDSREDWKTTRDQLIEARDALVRAYDDFVRICHDRQLIDV